MKKGGLKNFLNKNKKKAGGPDAAADASPGKESADTKPQETVVTPVEEKAPEKKAAKADSSDEEEDDLELQTGAYGKIAEEEEKAVTQGDDESKNTNAFTMDTQEEQKPDEPVKKEKKTASNITFGGGRPRFGNRALGRAAVLNTDDTTLADLLDEPAPSKKKAKKETEMALTRQTMAQQKQSEPVEEKKGPQKPTFRGKLNLKGAGADTTDSGVKTNYGFEVKYRAERLEEGAERQEKPATEIRAAPKKMNRHLGQQITLEEAERQETRTVDEDGFELVGAGNTRKERRQMGRRDDFDDEDDFKITKEDKRGGAFAAMNG